MMRGRRRRYFELQMQRYCALCFIVQNGRALTEQLERAAGVDEVLERAELLDA